MQLLRGRFWFGLRIAINIYPLHGKSVACFGAGALAPCLHGVNWIEHRWCLMECNEIIEY